MARVSDAMARALEAYQAGDLARAEELLRDSLAVSPGAAEAWNLLGVVCMGRGHAAEATASLERALEMRPEYPEALNNLGAIQNSQGQARAAEASLRRALDLQPDYAEAHNNLGNALRAQGRLDEALACYAEALRRRPSYGEAWHNRGVVLAALGRWEEAAASYRESLALRPQAFETLNNLGLALAQLRHHDEAVAQYDQALRLKPDYAEAHHNRGLALAWLDRMDESVASLRRAIELEPDRAEMHNSLGKAHGQRRQFAEALACFDRAVGLKPDYAEAINNRGVTLFELGRHEDAMADVERALRLAPNYAEAINNRGKLLSDRGRLDDAVAEYDRALRIRPDYVHAHTNRGHAITCLGRLDEGLECFETALRIEPDYAEARLNRAIVWLTMGRFEEGWPEYEWRWKCPRQVDRPPFPQPAWEGEPLDGKAILLHAEQGMGDMLQFVRYVPLVRDRGGRVILECHAPLVPFLARFPGVDRIVPRGGALPPFDVQAPLLSLPRIFGTTEATIPAAVPYLFADPARIAAWRDRLGDVRSFRVGILWQGNPKYITDQYRSIPLERFESLARVPGVRLICLQKGYGAGQLAALNGRFEVHDLGPELDASGGAFLDTAAVMRLLDLVVTSDTAAAHLAGALGVPVWVALAYSADWRWLQHREDSPWYPTMRLFRQSAFGDWAGVFDRIAAELARMRERQPRRARAIAVEVSPGELLDKLTILELKGERIGDPARRANVRREFDLLAAARDGSVRLDDGLAGLVAELKAVNAALWEVEDAIRDCERRGDFGDRFVALARSVYRENDRRSALKRQINDRLGSHLVEEKSYGSDGVGPDEGRGL